jgi:ubiquinone/menaquinone biosynthesis C-methylase UbiE
MGFVFDYDAAREYDNWYRDQKHRFVADLEDQLMLRLLEPQRGERLLDIGCGTGRHLAMFAAMGLNVTGLDASPHMLDLAGRRLGHRAALHQGIAEDLPFEDNTFDVATLITTLEFVDDPQKAIEEACRVAKNRVFFGVLNRYAIKAVERRIKGIFTRSIYNRASFFSVWDLTRRVRRVLDKTPIRRGTVCQLPASLKRYTHGFERWSFVQRSPFGAFVGMAVTLVPRYRTQNVPIDYVRKATGVISGLMQSGNHSRWKE